MNTPKVSIVLPVYNSEPYLDRTIRDIHGQIFTEWELICVDDGSTDRSLAILRENAKNDDRIRIITQRNQGAGVARNEGLKQTTGEYVIFLDSDDSFSQYLLAEMYSCAKRYELDVCICGYSFLDKDDKGTFDRSYDIPGDVFRLDDLGDDGIIKCGLIPWNKLVKRQRIIENTIWFQNLSSSNDVFFTCMVLAKASRLFFLNDSSLIRHYTSISGQISENRKPINLLYAVEALFDERLNSRTSAKVREILLFGGLSELRRCRNADDRELFYDKLIELLSVKKEIFSDISETQRKLISLYELNEEENKWWEADRIVSAQLEENNAELSELMCGYKQPVLWGFGKRGSAFIDFCKQHGLNIRGITDKRFDDDVQKQSATEGIEFMQTSKAIEIADLIIAGNTNVYNYLQKQCYDKAIINLETYCPII